MLSSACGLKVDWGLSRLQNYGAAFVELPLMKFGVPLAGPDAFIMPGPQLELDCQFFSRMLVQIDPG